MSIIFELQNHQDSEVEAHLAKQIRLHKHQSAPDYFLEDGSPIGWQPLTITLRDGESNLIGGLTGSTMFSGLHIKWLWVNEIHRNNGYASEMMRQAIDVAKQRGCTFAWFDTWSVQGAYAFYDKLGAKVVMRMDDFPPGSTLLHYRLDFD